MSFSAHATHSNLSRDWRFKDSVDHVATLSQARSAFSEIAGVDFDEGEFGDTNSENSNEWSSELLARAGGVKTRLSQATNETLAAQIAENTDLLNLASAIGCRLVSELQEAHDTIASLHNQIAEIEQEIEQSNTKKLLLESRIERLNSDAATTDDLHARLRVVMDERNGLAVQLQRQWRALEKERKFSQQLELMVENLESEFTEACKSHEHEVHRLRHDLGVATCSQTQLEVSLQNTRSRTTTLDNEIHLLSEKAKGAVASESALKSKIMQIREQNNSLTNELESIKARILGLAQSNEALSSRCNATTVQLQVTTTFANSLQATCTTFFSYGRGIKELYSTKKRKLFRLFEQHQQNQQQVQRRRRQQQQQQHHLHETLTHDQLALVQTVHSSSCDAIPPMYDVWEDVWGYTMRSCVLLVVCVVGLTVVGDLLPRRR